MDAGLRSLGFGISVELRFAALWKARQDDCFATKDQPQRPKTKVLSHATSCQHPLQTNIDQLLGVIVLKNARVGAFAKLLNELLCAISNSSGASQTADYLSFVVGNREFIQRAHCSGNEQDNVARSYENNIPSLQAKPGVDNRITGIDGKFVLIDMLLLVDSG